jgi:hypothetical protein
MSSIRLPCALSDRRAAFAEAYARHHNASQAARDAGYAPACASVTGTRLLANASVQERICELEAQTAVDLGVTRQQFLFELQEAAALAKEKKEPAAMIAAWREIGKACGFYAVETKRVELSAGQGAVQANFMGMSDAQLLVLIAKGAGAA